MLDHLLSDERLAIEGISGTSAGAVNAVMLADGLARGGREEAQKRLADFWRAASSTGNLPALQRAVMERLLSFTPLEGTPVQAWFDALSRYFSPYDVNPLNINPLKDLIERFVDFDALRANSGSADFHLGDQCADRPRAHFSARKDHRRCGDGFGLPAAAVPRGRDRRRALLGRRLSRQSGRSFRFSAPPRPRTCWWCRSIRWCGKRRRCRRSEIMNRINEITFNSSLIGEYRAIDFVARLIDQGRLPRGTGPGEYRRINVHRIVLDRFGTHFDAFSKLSTDYDFFEMLHVSGKRAARRFLDEHFDDIGVKSTVDLRAEAQAEWA